MIRTKILVLATVLSAAACATEPVAATPAEPAIGAIPVVRSGADIVLPLDAFVATDQQQRTMNAAVTIVGQNCMKRFGLAWPAVAPPAATPAAVNVRRYGLVELDKARAEGYHAPDIEKYSKAIAAAQAKAAKPTDDAMNVWAGRGEQSFAGQPVPPGGCAAEAVAQLTAGAPAADPGIPQKLQLMTFNRTKTDSRVTRVFAAWSRCMAAQGLSYATPFDALGDRRWYTGPVSARETTVAAADVTCKTQTNLAGTMMAVETGYQQRAIEQNAAALDAVRTLLTTEIANSTRVAG
jgi:hypothetical protein